MLIVTVSIYSERAFVYNCSFTHSNRHETALMTKYHSPFIRILKMVVLYLSLKYVCMRQTVAQPFLYLVV